MSGTNEGPRAYEAWVAKQGEVTVTSGFADRVMEEVVREGNRSRARAPRSLTLERLLVSRPLRIAVSVLALAVGVSRFVYLALAARLITFE